MKKFAATKPVSNFFLLWVLGLSSAAFSETATAEIAVVLFYYIYLILWPLLVYKYLIDQEDVVTKYGRKDLDFWATSSTAFLLICITIGIYNPAFEEKEIYIISTISAGVYWCAIYFIICWRASKLLISRYDRKFFPHKQFHSSHGANLYAFLIWPSGGIFYVGDKLLRLFAGRKE